MVVFLEQFLIADAMIRSHIGSTRRCGMVLSLVLLLRAGSSRKKGYLEEGYLVLDKVRSESRPKRGRGLPGAKKSPEWSRPWTSPFSRAPPPIEVPALSLEELNEKTGNFGSKALIGEGSYGKVYYANLNNVKAVAVKKLEVSSEPESNVEFLTQVSMVSRLKLDNLVELQGYCVEGNLRVLAYGFATMGSLYDILHELYVSTGQWTQKSDVYCFGVILLELLIGRKPVDFTLPRAQWSLVTWATPRLGEHKVEECIDPKLEEAYPPKAVAKVFLSCDYKWVFAK
ncbi:hypothetical protein PTKIN_Ptkin11bG0084800 [Pterospermum kingtungense]